VLSCTNASYKRGLAAVVAVVNVVRVKCGKCGYEWEYKGGLLLATCPNCGRKVKVLKGAQR
jgi:ribosomal protein S27AE